MKNKIKSLGNTFVIFFFCVALVIAIFVTGTQLAIYSNIDYYQKEYEKYQVADDMDMALRILCFVSVLYGIVLVAMIIFSVKKFFQHKNTKIKYTLKS